MQPTDAKKDAIAPISATAQALTPRQEEERAVVVEMERRDEEQIMKELDGEITDEYFYEVRTREGAKRKMTYSGIKEVARRMGNITVEKPEISPSPFDEHYMILRIAARDEQRNYTTTAMVEQCLWLTHSNGKVERDEFAVQKGTAKVIRNVLRALIPEATMTRHINEWAEAKRTRGAAVPETANPLHSQRGVQTPTASPPDSSKRETSPPSTKSAIEAAMDTIFKFRDASESNRKTLWTMLSVRGYNLQNFPGWDHLPEEDIAFMLREIQGIKDAQTAMGKEAFKPAGEM